MSMRRRLANLSMVVVVCALAPAMLFAQATSQISGRVTDRTGAVLPGVEVTLTRTDTGVVRNAVTNETGAYAFPSLNPGPFRLEASLAGFRTFVQSGIVLQVGANLVIDANLEVGEVAQTVEVQANSEIQRAPWQSARWSKANASSSCLWPPGTRRR
jgi:hypothetical protein